MDPDGDPARVCCRATPRLAHILAGGGVGVEAGGGVHVDVAAERGPRGDESVPAHDDTVGGADVDEVGGSRVGDDRVVRDRNAGVYGAAACKWLARLSDPPRPAVPPRNALPELVGVKFNLGPLVSARRKLRDTNDPTPPHPGVVRCCK